MANAQKTRISVNGDGVTIKLVAGRTTDSCSQLILAGPLAAAREAALAYCRNDC